VDELKHNREADLGSQVMVNFSQTTGAYLCISHSLSVHLETSVHRCLFW